jgi:hypothetical protein
MTRMYPHSYRKEGSSVTHGSWTVALLTALVEASYDEALVGRHIHLQ